MPILGAIVVPHPPLIIPIVGRGQERQVQATIDAYRTAAKQVADWKPEVLVISSPHTIMYTDCFHISPGMGASGSMASFGVPQPRLGVKYDTALHQQLVQQAETANLRAGTLGERDSSLNHGTFLPLYFCKSYFKMYSGMKNLGINLPNKAIENFHFLFLDFIRSLFRLVYHNFFQSAC